MLSFSSNAFNNIVNVTSTIITYEVAQNSAENVTPQATNAAIPENINSTVCVTSTPTNNTTPDIPISISIPISGYQSRLLSTPISNSINDQFSSTPMGPISTPMAVVTKKKQRTPKFYDDEQTVLTSEQQNILNFALNGKSLFFTGAAGTGKVIERSLEGSKS